MTEIENMIANKELGTFSGKHGGTVDIVGGSVKAQMAAAEILSPLSDIARNSAIGALLTVPTGDPLIIGLGAMGGAFSSVTNKPRIR